MTDPLARLRRLIPGVEPYRRLVDGSPCYCETQETILHPGWQHSLLCKQRSDDYAAVEEYTAALPPAPDPLRALLVQEHRRVVAEYSGNFAGHVGIRDGWVEYDCDETIEDCDVCAALRQGETK